MGIFKARLSDQYTKIPNETLQDTSLSFEAKGLLVLILSLPENWEIHKSWLQKQAQKCGQDKLKRLLKELTDTGYMVKKVKQSEDGKLAGWDWFVYPEKQLEPAKIAASTVGVKNRPSVKPSDGKSGTTNKTNKQINKKTNSELVTVARARNFPVDRSENFSDRVMAELQSDNLPEHKYRYAKMKISEFQERFPESTSVADCWAYVVTAVNHQINLTG